MQRKAPARESRKNADEELLQLIESVDPSHADTTLNVMETFRAAGIRIRTSKPSADPVERLDKARQHAYGRIRPALLAAVKSFNRNAGACGDPTGAQLARRLADFGSAVCADAEAAARLTRGAGVPKADCCREAATVPDHYIHEAFERTAAATAHFQTVTAALERAAKKLSQGSAVRSAFEALDAVGAAGSVKPPARLEVDAARCEDARVRRAARLTPVKERKPALTDLGNLARAAAAAGDCASMTQTLHAIAPKPKTAREAADRADEVADALGRFGVFILEPLLLRVVEPSFEAPVLLVDEVPLDLPATHSRRSLAGLLPMVSEKLVALILSTPSDAQRPLFWCAYIGPREELDLDETLGDFAKTAVLVADATQPYANLISRGFRAKRQGSLHLLRRNLTGLLDPKTAAKEAELDPELLEKQILADLGAEEGPGRDARLALTAVRLVSGVLELEAEGGRRADETEAERLERVARMRREDSKRLMDALDAVMAELARGRVKPTKSGGSWRKAKTDAAAEVSVHYLKNQRIYRTFLSDARVPPATDLFEGRILPAAVLQRNADLLDEIDGRMAAAAALSLTTMLRRAGDEDPAQWMEKHAKLLVETFRRKTGESLW